jgi:hypothetical protein
MEIDTLKFLYKREDIAFCRTTKAVVRTSIWRNKEGWSFFVMEGTAGLKVFASFFELDIGTDNIGYL